MSRLQAAFAIPTSQIYVHNLGEGLEARFENETVSVQITGSNANLAELANNIDTITGYIDAVGLSDGAYELPLKLNLGKAYNAKTVNARIVLRKKDPSLLESQSPEQSPSVMESEPAPGNDMVTPETEPVGDPLAPSADPSAQPGAQ